jgi:hypothetical protein
LEENRPSAPPDAIGEGDAATESSEIGGPEIAAEAFDPFDPEALRVDPNSIHEQIGVEKAILTCPVRKPDKQEFVRVHPDRDFKIDLPILEDRDSREVFLVDKSIAPSLPDFIKVVRLVLAINRHDDPFLWMARLPTSDRRDNWADSMLKAQELAVTCWVRVQSSMASGCYVCHKATGKLPEPKWPDKKMRDYLALAFGGSRIDDVSHPVVQRLYGAA